MAVLPAYRFDDAEHGVCRWSMADGASSSYFNVGLDTIFT